MSNRTTETTDASRTGEGSLSQDGFATRAIHAGQSADPLTGAVVPPISLATTFAQEAVGVHHGYDYSRTANPTRGALEACLSSLEGANFGVAYASGLAAEDAVLHLLRSGDHLVMADDAYGGTYRLIDKVWRRLGVVATPARLDDPAALREALRPTTKLIWLETPSNPLLKIVDIAATAEIAHANGARLIVDNTFATPYLQNPLQLGADAVVHSATKYLGGHSDVVGGFVATSDEELASHLRFQQNSVGAVPSPFDCYLLMRGVKTLALRMDRHAGNAEEIVEMLSAHRHVERVLYPGDRKSVV